MKKFWISLLAIVMGTAAAFSQNVSIKSLIGRWESSDGAGLEIIDSSRIFLIYGTERKPILTYHADFSKSPIWFDFVVKDSSENLSSMKSLLALEKGELLRWQVFVDGERTAHFSTGRGEIVILRRKK